MNRLSDHAGLSYARSSQASSGNPESLVVFVTGEPSDASSWQPIVGEVANVARVQQVVIDLIPSPGSMGEPGELEVLVNDLAGALDSEVGVPRRVVLVGVSIWALFAELTAASLQQVDAALVVVDPTPARFLNQASWPQLTRSTFEQSRRTSQFDRLASLDTQFREELEAALQRARPSRVPATVIFPGLQPAADDLPAQVWVREQHAELRTSPNSREVIAGRSRFCIPQERPEVVVEAIKERLARTQ